MKMCISVYPNGDDEETGRCLSIFLCYVSNDCAKSERVRPCYTISIKDQSNDLQHHQMTFSDCWFEVSDVWGYSVIELSSLNDPTKGLIVNDCCLIEIELVEQAISS
ncbi:hypothetical protein CASFOL_012885 [Castilleja foliolosa]|uniref:MATH domain-containing protein n=1 Tax=Castilleja foliolosa TaxID=1961234 RepID=A0ABD3DMF8_9LAMI